MAGPAQANAGPSRRIQESGRSGVTFFAPSLIIKRDMSSAPTTLPRSARIPDGTVIILRLSIPSNTPLPPVPCEEWDEIPACPACRGGGCPTCLGTGLTAEDVDFAALRRDRRLERLVA